MCLFAITFITSIYIISVYLTLYLSPTMDNKNDDDNNSIISMKLLIIAICTVSHNAFIVTLSMFSSTTPQSPILRKRGQTTDIQSLVILSRLLQKTPIPYPFWEHRVKRRTRIHCTIFLASIHWEFLVFCGWRFVNAFLSPSHFFLLGSVELRPSSSTSMPFCTPFCSIVREQFCVPFYFVSCRVSEMLLLCGGSRLPTSQTPDEIFQ